MTVSKFLDVSINFSNQADQFVYIIERCRVQLWINQDELFLDEKFRRTSSIFHPEITSPDLSIIARARPLDYLLIAFINCPEGLRWWVYVKSECNYNNGVQFRNNYCVRNGDYNAF